MRIKVIFLFISVFLFCSCMNKRDTEKRETVNKPETTSLNNDTKDFTITEFFVEKKDYIDQETLFIYEINLRTGEKKTIFIKENVRNSIIYENLCIYEINKSESQISELYYINKTEHNFQEHYISSCFGCLKIKNGFMVNVRNPNYPYLVDIYSLENFALNKEIDLKDMCINKPYLVDSVKVELQDAKDGLLLSYSDQWDEIFEKFSIEFPGLGISRNQIEYSKNKYLEKSEDRKIRRKSYSMSKSKKIKNLGLWINWNITGDNSLFIDSSPHYSETPENPIWKMSNVVFYIYNAEKNKVLFLNDISENKDGSVNILDINTLEVTCLGKGKSQPILTENWNYIAFIENNSKAIHIQNINDRYNEEIVKYITEYLDEAFIDCDFVTFEYPILELLFKFENTADKLLLLNLESNNFLIEEVNKEEEIVPDLPSVH